MDSPSTTLAKAPACFHHKGSGQAAVKLGGRKNGKPTSELSVLRLAKRPLHELYGAMPAAEFGPLRLKACRERMIDAALSRTTIIGYVSHIRQAFRWAVENELVPGEVLQALRAVAGLKRGRSRAKENEPVRPVDRLVLVDGKRLADLMVQFEVGVTPRPVRVPKLDADYFESAWGSPCLTDGVLRSD